MAESTGSTRRDFLKRSAAVSTALAAPTIIPAHVLGRDNAPSANEQIIIGLIGTGGRCNQLIDQVPAGGKIVAASDCYLYRATETLPRRKKPTGSCTKTIARCSTARSSTRSSSPRPTTPARCPAFAPCMHGLDVYAEKPLTAYIHEGRVAGRRTFASTNAFSKSARSSARWRSTASAASSSATASSARSNKSRP